MPKEAGSGIPKKHISTACTWCRNRKVKCDGQTPTCSNCVLYQQRCEYDYSDKRRIPHKKAIQSLQNRVTLLENLLQKHGIEVPPESGSVAGYSTVGFRNVGAESVRNDVLPHNLGQLDTQPEFPTTMQHFDEQWMAPCGIPDSDPQHPSIAPWQNVYPTDPEVNNMMQSEYQTTMHQFDNHAVNLSALSANNDPHRFLPAVGKQNNPATNNQIQKSSEISHISPQSGSTSYDLQSDDDDIMDQLSARIGAFQIAEDGQLRYFGATSNLHILHDGLLSLSQGLSRSVRLEGEETLARAGLNKTADPELEKQLEDLYFTWEDPAIHVVDKEMYFMAKNAYNSGQDGNSFYSETLKYAICAAGSCLTSRTDFGLPQEAAAFFSSQAKLLLEIEMDGPSIATVQALVIMSATEAAFKRDARGWLYSGMAVRLSADLGLHLDLTNDMQNGILSAHELDVRRTTFWGVFVQDNMWSLYLGRPWGINIKDISVSRPPKHMDKLRSKRWNTSSNPYEAISNVENEGSGWYDPVEMCADANVSLCVMMRQLNQTVYSGKNLSEERLRQFATNMRAEFNAWERDLPVELSINLSNETQPYLPHVLQLHMQFYAISILLHRPFFSSNVRNPDSLNQSSPTDPRLICISAAQSIVKLLRIYRRQHTLRRTNVNIVHLIFTASLICVYNTCISKGVAATSAGNDLQFCCQALAEIGEAYQNASRSLEVIICIKREWFSKSRNLSRLKKRGSMAEVDDTSGMGRKRRFTQTQYDAADMPSTDTVAVLSGREIFHAENQNSQEFNMWHLQDGDFGRTVGSESFFGNLFSVGAESSLLDPGSGHYGGSV